MTRTPHDAAMLGPSQPRHKDTVCGARYLLSYVPWVGRRCRNHRNFPTWPCMHHRRCRTRSRRLKLPVRRFLQKNSWQSQSTQSTHRITCSSLPALVHILPGSPSPCEVPALAHDDRDRFKCGVLRVGQLSNLCGAIFSRGRVTLTFPLALHLRSSPTLVATEMCLG